MDIIVINRIIDEISTLICRYLYDFDREYSCFDLLSDLEKLRSNYNLKFKCFCEVVE